nr:PREDICTED: EF-hand calcium-binding domain-containing protein 1-like [Paralichthys olivaceus]
MSAMKRKSLHTLAETLSKQVQHFSKTEVEALIGLYHDLLGESAAPGRAVTGLDRSKFRNFLFKTFEMTDSMIMDEVLSFILFNDHDHDGRLSFDDFEKSVREENLLLEAFGNCLPDTESIETFEQNVFQKK